MVTSLRVPVRDLDLLKRASLELGEQVSTTARRALVREACAILGLDADVYLASGEEMQISPGALEGGVTLDDSGSPGVSKRGGAVARKRSAKGALAKRSRTR